MKAIFWGTVSLLVLLSGCGSLSETECLAIDWNQVGLEDGQNGRDMSRVDSYQEDCAKHSVQADIEAYSEGREEGLRTFCRPENGFEAGKSGYQFLGICPADLAGAFLAEYNIGVEFYYVYRDMSNLESAISGNLDTVDKLDRGISGARIALDNPNLTIREEFELEQQIRSMEDQIQEYERDYGRLQSLLGQKIRELQDLKYVYGK